MKTTRTWNRLAAIWRRVYAAERRALRAANRSQTDREMHRHLARADRMRLIRERAHALTSAIA